MLRPALLARNAPAALPQLGTTPTARNPMMPASRLRWLLLVKLEHARGNESFVAVREQYRLGPMVSTFGIDKPVRVGVFRETICRNHPLYPPPSVNGEPGVRGSTRNRGVNTWATKHGACELRRGVDIGLTAHKATKTCHKQHRTDASAQASTGRNAAKRPYCTWQSNRMAR